LQVETASFLGTIGLAALATCSTILVAPLVDVVQPHRLFLFGEALVLVGFFLALVGSSSIGTIGLAWFLFMSGNSINNGCIQASRAQGLIFSSVSVSC
jgi:hypothetical protein